MSANPTLAREAILAAAAPVGEGIRPLSLSRVVVLEELQSPIAVKDRKWCTRDMIVTAYVMRQDLSALLTARSKGTIEHDALLWGESRQEAEILADITALYAQVTAVNRLGPGENGKPLRCLRDPFT